MNYYVTVANGHIQSYLWQSNTSVNKKEESTTSESDKAFLEKVKGAIEINLCKSPFGPKELAKLLHISVSKLFRKLKVLSNKSTSLYIRSVRLHCAMKLLDQTDHTISQVAFKTGFNDPSYFTRSFVKEFGITPGKVRIGKQHTK